MMFSTSLFLCQEQTHAQDSHTDMHTPIQHTHTHTHTHSPFLSLMVHFDTLGNRMKHCSRQLQYEVPCGVGNVINSSLFTNSSLSSLSSTRYAVRRGQGVPTFGRGFHLWWGRGGLAGGGGRGHFSTAAIYCTTTWGFALKGLRTIIQLLI